MGKGSAADGVTNFDEYLDLKPSEREQKVSSDIQKGEVLSKKKVEKGIYGIYGDDIKEHFFSKYIPRRTAYNWFEQDQKESEENASNEAFLERDYKDFSSATLDQAMDSLTNEFKDLKVSKSAVHRFMTEKCALTLKKAHFHSKERNSPESVEKRYTWVQKWNKTDMDFESNCVFVAKYVESRGYRCVHLPSYSSEFNPIEQFWSVVKNNVKRNRFLETETLIIRISEALNSLKLNDFKCFVWHSHKCFGICRNKQEL
ncbi:hypothetical protein G6F70_008548 [Rhizopus microsporus]|nr:hypothetical protein G6F71_002392 [Rhizopus microsporus]KAG1195025.1 hypothetical protein G6F70_008548 [Rhizopus microsporus]